MLELFVRPEVNEAAIRSYAEGVGLEYQGRYEEAIDKFTDAITENPYYAKAYYERGLSYYELDDLATAISEMEAARGQGLNDTSINWNLGWTYYLSGDYAKAFETNERILSEHPEVLGMRMNQAISYLAAGDLTNAQAQYDLLVQEALNQVAIARQNGAEPSASLWYYMDAGALDLENLIAQLDNTPREWTQAPSASLVTGDHNAIRTFASEQMKRLKETTVSLEYTGQLPAAQETMQVSSFIFGQITETDAEGFIIGFEPAQNSIIPYGEKGFSVEYVYSGPAPSQLIWKVYINGYEDQSLRIVSNFDISSGTIWYQTFGYQYNDVFILASGEYAVELYADNILVQRGTFYVQ